MVSQISPDFYEAYDVEYVEEQAWREQLAAEAAAAEALSPETLAWLENAQDLCARVDALLAHSAAMDAQFAREREEILARAAEADYWSRQAARASYGDWIARQAEAQATDEEPTGYREPTDEDLCAVR